MASNIPDQAFTKDNYIKMLGIVVNDLFEKAHDESYDYEIDVPQRDMLGNLVMNESGNPTMVKSQLNDIFREYAKILKGKLQILVDESFENNTQCFVDLKSCLQRESENVKTLLAQLEQDVANIALATQIVNVIDQTIQIAAAIAKSA